MTSSSISARTTSGDIRIDESQTAALTIDSTSGDVAFEGSAGTVDANTISGDIFLAFESIGGEMNVGHL